jgi:hypothetical protein
MNPQDTVLTIVLAAMFATAIMALVMTRPVTWIPSVEGDRAPMRGRGIDRIG